MTNPTDSEKLVAVEKCDEDAAMAYWGASGPMRMGAYRALADAFARHRMAERNAWMQVVGDYYSLTDAKCLLNTISSRSLASHSVEE